MFSVEVTTHSWDSNWEEEAETELPAAAAGATDGELTEDFDLRPFLAFAGGVSPSLYFLHPTGLPLFLGTLGVTGLDISTPGAGAGPEVGAGVEAAVGAAVGDGRGSIALVWSTFTKLSAKASLSREFLILSSESPEGETYGYGGAEDVSHILLNIKLPSLLWDPRALLDRGASRSTWGV